MLLLEINWNVESSLNMGSAKGGREAISPVVFPSYSFGVHEFRMAFSICRQYSEIFSSCTSRRNREIPINPLIYSVISPVQWDPSSCSPFADLHPTWFPSWGLKDEGNIWKHLHGLLNKWYWNYATSTFLSSVSKLFHHTTVSSKPCCSWCYVVKAAASLEKSCCSISSWMAQGFWTDAWSVIKPL